MKVVINKCFGGFGLSRDAVKRMAELQGRQCFFFMTDRSDYQKYIPAPTPSEGSDIFWTAFDIPNPNEVVVSKKDWRQMTPEDRKASNALYMKHNLPQRPDDRSDPLLIRVVEELGEEKASGGLAELRIVEVPDDIKWELDDYDGVESIHEQHQIFG